MADAEGVKMPWPYKTWQVVSGKLLNRMLHSGAEFDVIEIVIPKSSKSEVANDEEKGQGNAESGEEAAEGETAETSPNPET